jgi:hypothetical protein
MMGSDQQQKSLAQEVNEASIGARAEPYWTSLRLEIKGWLNRNAPSSEELYIGALEILYSPTVRGKTRFVAHAVREIANRLPEIITGIKSSRFEWQNKLDGIVKRWEQSGFLLDGTLPTITASQPDAPVVDFPMPRNVMQDIASLLSEYAATRERASDRARRLFEGIDPRNRRAQETLTPIVTQWLKVTSWFLKHVHDSGAPDAVDPSELQIQFELFETALGALTREFFKTIGELDAILEKANA